MNRSAFNFVKGKIIDLLFSFKGNVLVNHSSLPYGCYILGSGRSLLNITTEEITHINHSPFSLAFNKYIIFHDKIGIIPTHYLLADHGDKALLMFRETMRVCERKQLNKIKFIFSDTLIKKVKKIPELRKYLTRNIRERSVLIARHHWLEGGSWAETLEEPIYHYRGSLSGAINIASIVNPLQTIKLLGVDLNDYDYFFQEEIERNKKKWGIFLKRLTPESSQHTTISSFKGSEGIQKAFPFIVQNIKKNKGDLVCCNSESYLVTQKILDYRPIIDS